MTLPEALAGAIQAWADFKADHREVSRGLAFAHLAGIFLGGGTAITIDRAVRRAARGAAAVRAQVLDDLHGAHRVVVPALALVFVTGSLWTLTELDEFLGSWLYWLKMGLIACLLVNGYAMVRAEQSARAGSDAAWGRLRAGATISLVLWFAILAAGRFL